MIVFSVFSIFGFFGKFVVYNISAHTHVHLMQLHFIFSELL